MSTDHQKYSTENQADAIRRYAEKRGYEIVHTYADEGKSGLRLDGRDALKQLISDVETGVADYSVVLVYDVSRWGRFQDADESAYYEYLCKRAGIAVRYCAEQFENDGSPVSTIVKGVKRAMAGEYSRELSAKVFAGQSRLIEKGYRQGGPAGFGLRRHRIDQHGNSKGDLERGEHKSIQTDRVILKPGPESEVDVVKWIYAAFVDGGIGEREIAAALNARGVLTDLGRPWTRGVVHQVLINEKYIGHNVWNRVSNKLKQQRVENPPETWIRADEAFTPIVDASVFAAAQSIIQKRVHRLSDEDVLASLARLLRERGALSGAIIDEAEHTPSSSVFRGRFGSLLHAYQLVGYTPDRDLKYVEINRVLRKLHPKIVDEAVAEVEKIGGTIVKHPVTDLLSVNNEFTTSVVVSRCRETFTGRLQWNIRLDASLLPDLTIAVRMDKTNTEPFDFFILPSIDMSAPALRLGETNGFSLDSYRFESLEAFYLLSARTQLLEVA